MCDCDGGGDRGPPRQDVVAEDRAPLRDDLVGGDQQAAAFVPAGDELKKEMGAASFKRQIAEPSIISSFGFV